MKRIEIRECAVCGGSYRAADDTGEPYPIYDGPNPCTCEGGPTPDVNESGFDVVRRATEGR